MSHYIKCQGRTFTYLFDVVWVPKNPNQLKCLIFNPVMITLDPWIFPALFTSRDKGSDHATRHLNG